MKSGLLLSGGMDSSALACWQRPEVAFTIDYGQLPAAAEIHAASKICESYSIQHEIIAVDCRGLGSGDLAGQPSVSQAPVSEWWPFRNQLLLTLAAMRAVAIGVDTLLFGSVCSDAVHADGRKKFFERIDALTCIQEANIRVAVPAIEMTSAELIRASGIDFPTLAWAHSCHTYDFACGDCRGCFKHQTVMAELGYEWY